MNAAFLLELPAIVDNLTERLGWCALHFLWQGAGIAILLAALLWICQKGTAELRYACCGIALLLMAVAPLLTWHRFRPAGNRPFTPDISAVSTQSLQNELDSFAGEIFDSEPLQGHEIRSSFSPPPPAETALPPATLSLPPDGAPVWQAWLGRVWLFGAGLMGIWRLSALGFTVLLVRRATKAGDAIMGQITRMAGRCGLHRAPLVRITSYLISPAVAGILRPVLLLPAGALAGLSPRELDFILAHEFAHIRRQDFLIGLLQAALETLLFFHPAVWWVSHRMSLEREHACDDAALRITGDPQEGAKALARLAELSLHTSPALVPAAAGHHLLHRVRRLLAASPRRSRSGPVALVPLLFGSLLIPLFMLQKAESQNPASAPGIVQLISEPSWMRGTITDRNGVILAESSEGTWERDGVIYQGIKRTYPLRALASHVLGYTKQSRAEKPTESGLSGVEKLADAVLHAVPAKDGKAQPAVVLTLDARIQQICMDALREGGVGRGTAVVLDVTNGDILAMASLPDFDPNQFIPFITQENWDPLNINETQPLLNRAVSDYEPGSTFKLITALAAGSSGGWKASYSCTGSVDYGGRAFKCWTVPQKAPAHGKLRLPEALRRSCNCYFYQLGNAAGIGSITTMAGKFGIGQVSFFRLGTPMQDFMPEASSWEMASRGPWTSAKTANVSIGQGEVRASPLQMAGVAASVANSGKIWNPRIIARSLEGGVWKTPSPTPSHDLLKEGVPEETLAALRQGMWEVVHEADGGTGKRADSGLVAIAGKTGTAQKWRIAGNIYNIGKESQRAMWEMQMQVATMQLQLGTLKVLNGEQLIEAAMKLNIKDGTIDAFANKYKTDQVNYIRLTTTGFGKRHPKVVGLVKQIQEEKRILLTAAENYRSTLKINIKNMIDALDSLKDISNGSGGKIADNHGHFIGFAPFEKPRYAFSIVVANAKSGGSTAAPVAKRIMEKITLMDEGKITVIPTPQAPAAGHFNFLESVSYPVDAPGVQGTSR